MDISDREKGFVLWFTGLPCSGKTTVADRIAVSLKETHKHIERLDGDILRKTLSSDLGFSKKDREENLKRVTFICQLLSRNGVGVIASFVSPYEKGRRNARDKTTNFIEIFVDCPLEECRKRDVKGMYKLADKGEIESFTGVSDSYEAPVKPEIILHTGVETIEESCDKVIEYLKDKGMI